MIGFSLLLFIKTFLSLTSLLKSTSLNLKFVLEFELDTMPERRSLRSRAFLTSQVDQPPAKRAMGRPRRTGSGTASQSVTVARATSRSPDDTKKSIRLTVKMPSSKLREATSGSSPITAPNPKENFEGGDIISGPRGSRAKRSIVVESESEEEEDEEDVEQVPSDDEPEDEEDEEQDDNGDEDEKDEEEEEEEEDDEEDDEEDAEGESIDVAADMDADTDADAEGDIEMEDASLLPHPPVLKMNGPTQKPSLTVTPAKDEEDETAAAVVADTKMELADDDDEELSELESEGEEEDAEDAEGDEVGEMDEMDQDDEGRSQQEGSRASTPNVSKMTKRQRSRLDQVMGSDFLQLPMGMSTTLIEVFSQRPHGLFWLEEAWY